MPSNMIKVLTYLTIALLALLSIEAFAHGVDDKTRAFLEQNNGVQFIPFLYIGAKHMITGYDHLLFLVGVIFFLYRSRDVLLYVTMFTIGHSTTLLFGVLSDIQVNAYLIDAIIGFSVIYKGFDNLGGFKRCFNWQPNTQWAVLIFGLFHGFGLSSKIIEYDISPDGLVPNLLAFNIGVEIGQLLALSAILIVMGFWRRTTGFLRHAYTANVAMMCAGFMLVGYQLTGYFIA